MVKSFLNWVGVGPRGFEDNFPILDLTLISTRCLGDLLAACLLLGLGHRMSIIRRYFWCAASDSFLSVRPL